MTASAFCDNCGAPLSTTPTPAIQVTPGMQPRLVVVSTQIPVSLPGGKTEWLLGREDPGSNIFPDVDLTPHGPDAGGVSRRHCVIRYQGGQFSIMDLGATNNTFVNNMKLNPNTPQVLNHGDEVRLGRLVLRFYAN
jgi:pSer/pThr/pTyr-binding forkhead associated (FHA) protein